MIVIYTEWRNMGDIDSSLESKNNKKINLTTDTGVLNSISQSNIAITQFAEILNRPLFVQGRMPFEEEQQEKNIMTNLSPLKLSLEGIVISPVSSVAVARDLTNNTIIRIGVGMQHNGWRLKNVEAQSAEFERGGEIQTIKIEVGKTQQEKTDTPALKLPINRKGQTNLPRR
jgi:hypothetical protein